MQTLVNVTLPEMGESVSEGSIVEWRKKVGDWVDEGETLVDITTDKVDVEVPSLGQRPDRRAARRRGRDGRGRRRPGRDRHHRGQARRQRGHGDSGRERRPGGERVPGEAAPSPSW